MKPSIDITHTSACEKQLEVRIAPEGVSPVKDAVAREVQRDAILPCFRKGKAPQELVARQYAKAIREETLRRLMQQAFEDATARHRLKPVGPFEVTRLEFDEATGLRLRATVEVEPDFPLGSYRGIRLTRPPVTVTEAEISEALQRLQDSMAQLVPAGEGQPKQKQVPNRDDDFAKDVGFETLEKLKQHVEATLKAQKQTAQRQAVEQALCDELLKRHPFEVPPHLVERQTERLTRDFKAHLLLTGMAEEQVPQELAKFTEQLRSNATRLVKLWFLLNRIAEHESVSITQDELVAQLWELSKRWHQDPGQVRKLLDAQGLWPSVVSTIRQEKTITLLMAAAQLENGGVA